VLRDAVRAQRPRTPTGAWGNDVDGFLMQAWQTSVAERMGVAEPGADPAFDPSSIVAVPGATMTQRIGQSSRPSSGNESKCDSTITYTPKGGITAISERLDDRMCPLPSGDCIDQMIASGAVPPGSLKGAHYMVAGAVQQAGGVTRVTVRIVRVETGEIVATAMADVNGTDAAAVQRAANEAMKKLPMPGNC